MPGSVKAFSIKPANFLERINTLLGSTGVTSQQLQDSIASTEDLYKQVALLGDKILTQTE
ncbi:hypothetical protein [Dictyobacter kobayashii]|uniref:Uncharacterized protein n=1 Tax=Dictyobacter kobayashii TaxID=2014872 RepID=A0A402AW59_9CHLR|nr:hypothetical protein [Dictyobacter kobayashii]GCE23327.1 hypothetical protein KDK_71270 [Dictyobacter kobayashii]